VFSGLLPTENANLRGWHCHFRAWFSVGLSAFTGWFLLAISVKTRWFSVVVLSCDWKAGLPAF